MDPLNDVNTPLSMLCLNAQYHQCKRKCTVFKPIAGQRLLFDRRDIFFIIALDTALHSLLRLRPQFQMRKDPGGFDRYAFKLILSTDMPLFQVYLPLKYPAKVRQPVVGHGQQ